MRFSLKTTLLVLTLTCVAMAVWRYATHRQEYFFLATARFEGGVTQDGYFIVREATESDIDEACIGVLGCCSDERAPHFRHGAPYLAIAWQGEKPKGIPEASRQIHFKTWYPMNGVPHRFLADAGRCLPHVVEDPE